MLRSSYLKLNDLIEFKHILELFYDNTKEIKSNNEDQEKDLEKRKVLIYTVSKLYDKLLNIHAAKFDNILED